MCVWRGGVCVYVYVGVYVYIYIIYITLKRIHLVSRGTTIVIGVTWWVIGHRDQADFTQHREELTSLYTGLYTSILSHSLYRKYKLFSCYWS